MSDEKEFTRNRPSDEGRNNDPNVREESAQRPGVSTLSKSENEGSNEKLTKTGGDDFREEPRDPRADPTFDEVDIDDKL